MLAVAICISATVHAQQSRASLFGSVADSTGSPVVGASVILTNTGTNFEYPTTTNESGNYVLNDVPAGQSYRLTISKSGFRKSVRNGLTLEVDQRAQMDVRRELGASKGLADRPNVLRAPSLPNDFVDANPGRGIQWFDPSAFINPSLYTFGNVPRAISTVRQPAAFIVNVSTFKTFQLRERLKLQFRAEAFNAPNHTNYSAANGSFTAGSNELNANDAFGRITSARDPRRMQFALKLLF